jgi:hypothetical protein
MEDTCKGAIPRGTVQVSLRIEALRVKLFSDIRHRTNVSPDLESVSDMRCICLGSQYYPEGPGNAGSARDGDRQTKNGQGERDPQRYPFLSGFRLLGMSYF